MRVRISLIGLLLLAMICSSCGGDGGEASSSAYPSEAGSIELQRGPGMGFCVDRGELTAATIAVEESGATVSGRRVTKVLEDSEASCPEETTRAYEDSSVCVDEFSEVSLTKNQVDNIENAIGEIPGRQCRRDKNRACDPCVVTSLTVNDTKHSGDCCGEFTNEFGAKFRSAISKLEGVVSSEI